MLTKDLLPSHSEPVTQRLFADPSIPGFHPSGKTHLGDTQGQRS